MNVLLVDQENLGLDFALRAAAAGHSVRWHRYAPKRPVRDGEGFKQLTLVDDWRPHMSWAKGGLVVCTGNFRFLPELDRFREFGFRIFAPTVASARLEIEREAGMKAMEAVGIELPPYQTFGSLADAEAFARSSDRAWVHKPMGDEDNKALTYVAKDPADMVGFLQRQRKIGKPLKGKVMLQEKVDLLCELGVSGWFGPHGFLPGKFHVAIEHKNLMNGEKGPATGEQGTVCQYTDAEKLATDALLPMEPILKALGHRGDFCVGAGIDKNGKAWPFEFTARLGWPAFYIQCASHRGDPVQWMADLCDGKDSLKVSTDVAIGVVLAQPNYPYTLSPPELVEGNPIEGVEEIGDAAHLISVMMGKGPVMQAGKVVDAPTYQTTGEMVMAVTGLGRTIERARKKVYAAVDCIHFPNKMYRTDIGEKVAVNLDKLHNFGFIQDMRAI